MFPFRMKHIVLLCVSGRVFTLVGISHESEQRWDQFEKFWISMPFLPIFDFLYFFYSALGADLMAERKETEKKENKPRKISRFTFQHGHTIQMMYCWYSNTSMRAKGNIVKALSIRYRKDINKFVLQAVIHTFGYRFHRWIWHFRMITN